MAACLVLWPFSARTVATAHTLSPANHDPPHSLRAPQAAGHIGNIWDGFRESFDFVSGANDVVVIRHPDGLTLSSEFSVQVCLCVGVGGCRGVRVCACLCVLMLLRLRFRC